MREILMEKVPLERDLKLILVVIFVRALSGRYALVTVVE